MQIRPLRRVLNDCLVVIAAGCDGVAGSTGTSAVTTTTASGSTTAAP